MKVRQIRKRKPVPLMAANMGHLRRTIQRAMLRLLRNDAVGRATVARVVAHALPVPLSRIIITVPLAA